MNTKASTPKAMTWIEKLPNVPALMLKAVEAVRDKMHQAQLLDLEAMAIRGQAYRECLDLTARVGALYTPEQVEAAKQAAAAT
ncbi:stable inheritance protein KleA (plasmid) [Sphaerotilaceae bacterium SBD11-9]